MNSIDKNIFNSYATVETTFLNELATEVKTKGKKARVLKGEGYYVKYDGVEYDITAEQCRIHKLLKNNYNAFVEQLNSAKSDMLGVWKMIWGDRLPAVIADLEKAIEICQKYLDAFKAFITEGEEDEEETEEKTEETDTVENNDEIAVEAAPDAEITTTDATEREDVGVDALIRELRLIRKMRRRQKSSCMSTTKTHSTMPEFRV